MPRTFYVAKHSHARANAWPRLTTKPLHQSVMASPDRTLAPLIPSQTPPAPHPSRAPPPPPPRPTHARHRHPPPAQRKHQAPPPGARAPPPPPRDPAQPMPCIDTPSQPKEGASLPPRGHGPRPVLFSHSHPGSDRRHVPSRIECLHARDFARRYHAQASRAPKLWAPDLVGELTSPLASPKTQDGTSMRCREQLVDASPLFASHAECWPRGPKRCHG